MAAHGALKGLAAAGPIGSIVGLAVGANSAYMSADELIPSLQPGDLIEFDRGATYRHWAMYAGKGKVFNIDAESKNETKALISLRSLKSVADSSPGYNRVRKNNQEKVAAHFRMTARSPKDCVRAAESMVGKKVEYNFVGKNCEYYCTLWRYGTGFSTQVQGGQVTYFATLTVSQIWGGIFAVLGGAVGGPIGAGLGYTLGTAVIGGGMTAIFEGTGTTHHIQNA